MFTNCFIIELAVLSSRPDSVDLVSPLTKPEEGGVSNIQDKWSQRDPSYFFLVVISLDLTWTVDTKEFGYQGGLYRRLRTREDLKYNKDQATTVKAGSQSRIRLDQDMFSLEFDPVTAKDQGKYLCLINNRPMPDAVIHLNILGKTFSYLSG